MKNVTTTADEQLPEQAREVARANSWSAGVDFEALMARLCYARGGRKFDRDEMNER